MLYFSIVLRATPLRSAVYGEFFWQIRQFNEKCEFDWPEMAETEKENIQNERKFKFKKIYISSSEQFQLDFVAVLYFCHDVHDEENEIVTI